MFSVRSDIPKWCNDAGFVFFGGFFLGGGGVTDILGQMEQYTAIHTKGVLDWIKCFIQLDKWNFQWRGGTGETKKSDALTDAKHSSFFFRPKQTWIQISDDIWKLKNWPSGKLGESRGEKITVTVAMPKLALNSILYDYWTAWNKQTMEWLPGIRIPISDDHTASHYDDGRVQIWCSLVEQLLLHTLLCRTNTVPARRCNLLSEPAYQPLVHSLSQDIGCNCRGICETGVEAWCVLLRKLMNTALF